jgi:hypothetical protein
VNTRLVVVSLLFAAPSLLPQQSNELVLNQPPFAVYSAFWPNLHHVLWAEAWARRPPSEETAAGTLPEPLTAELTAQERRAWDAAVSYYDEEVADLHPLFEMRSIRKAMIAAGPELPETGLEPAHREALLAAAAVYRKYWWPAHDAANRAWLVDPMSKVASLTPAVPERLSRLYGVPWFTSGVRVDVVRVGTREGAFASIDPAPAHITLSSSAPALREWMAAEILFHESSHALAFPLMDDFAAELRMQRKASWHLWHVALFYLTGEVVRQTLAERGIPYEPYMYKTGLLERAWPEFRAPIETYWKPYVNGEVSRDDAIRHVVRASKGIQMSSANYFTDVMVRWRLWDAAAILAIALWTAFAARPASNGSTVVVVLLVAACLALSVRMLPHAAANVFLHALAVASSLMATRVVVSRLARSRFLRIVLAVIAAPLGYAAGRGLAMVSIWLVTGNAL